MSTAEASAQGLSGYNTFRASHLIYHDEINRDGGVVRLCYEAFKAFTDTIMVNQRHAMLQEDLDTKHWLAEGGFSTGRRLDTPVTWKWLNSLNLEHLKIASGLEITLKSILVEKGYIVQKIVNSQRYGHLAEKQKEEPISVSEVLLVDNYRYDGKVSYLPGLTDKSLTFYIIVNKPKYREVLGLADLDIDLIDEFRRLKNEIHFPNDAIETPIRAAHPVPISEFVISFINDWIVHRSNLIRGQRELGGAPLSILR